MSRVSSLLRSFDPFASCVSDAAIFYAVEEKPPRMVGSERLAFCSA